MVKTPNQKKTSSPCSVSWVPNHRGIIDVNQHPLMQPHVKNVARVICINIIDKFHRLIQCLWHAMWRWVNSLWIKVPPFINHLVFIIKNLSSISLSVVSNPKQPRLCFMFFLVYWYILYTTCKWVTQVSHKCCDKQLTSVMMSIIPS